MTPSITLSSGEHYHYLEPDPRVVNIEVIAASLSKQCRFSGHTRRFYSVAEHCYWASRVVARGHELAALLHDAAEAFVVDVPTPLKMLLPDYRVIEDRAHDVVAKVFGVTWTPEVKQADLVMLATEKRDLMPETAPWAHLEGIDPMARSIDFMSGNPIVWERRFINRFKELTDGRS